MEKESELRFEVESGATVQLEVGLNLLYLFQVLFILINTRAVAIQEPLNDILGTKLRRKIFHGIMPILL